MRSFPGTVLACCAGAPMVVYLRREMCVPPPLRVFGSYVSFCCRKTLHRVSYLSLASRRRAWAFFFFFFFFFLLMSPTFARFSQTTAIWRGRSIWSPRLTPAWETKYALQDCNRVVRTCMVERAHLYFCCHWFHRIRSGLAGRAGGAHGGAAIHDASAWHRPPALACRHIKRPGEARCVAGGGVNCHSLPTLCSSLLPTSLCPPPHTMHRRRARMETRTCDAWRGRWWHGRRLTTWLISRGYFAATLQARLSATSWRYEPECAG